MSSPPEGPSASSSKKQAISNPSRKDMAYANQVAKHWLNLHRRARVDIAQLNKQLAEKEMIIVRHSDQSFQIQQLEQQLQERDEYIESLQSQFSEGVLDEDVEMLDGVLDGTDMTNYEALFDSHSNLIEQFSNARKAYELELETQKQNFEDRWNAAVNTYNEKEKHLSNRITSLQSELAAKEVQYAKDLNEKNNQIAALTSRNAATAQSRPNIRTSVRGSRYLPHVLPQLPLALNPSAAPSPTLDTSSSSAHGSSASSPSFAPGASSAANNASGSRPSTTAAPGTSNSRPSNTSTTPAGTAAPGTSNSRPSNTSTTPAGTAASGASGPPPNMTSASAGVASGSRPSNMSTTSAGTASGSRPSNTSTGTTSGVSGPPRPPNMPSAPAGAASDSRPSNTSTTSAGTTAGSRPLNASTGTTASGASGPPRPPNMPSAPAGAASDSRPSTHSAGATSGSRPPNLSTASAGAASGSRPSTTSAGTAASGTASTAQTPRAPPRHGGIPTPFSKRAWPVVLAEQKKQIDSTLSEDQIRQFKAIALQIWRNFYGRDTDAEYVDYMPADPAIVDAFLKGNNLGPGDDAVMYFGNGYSGSRWNKRIVEKFRDIAKVKIAEEYPDLPDIPDGYLEHLFYRRFMGAANQYNRCKPQYIDGEGRLETTEEAAERAGQQAADEVVLKALRSGRKRQKFDMRLDRVTNIIALKSKNPAEAGDLAVWEQLKRGLIRLGQDGQSDEEEDPDGEIGGVKMTVFRVYKAPWRAHFLTSSLHLIDNFVQANGLRKTVGPKLTPRRPVNEVHVLSRPPKSLPRSFYHPEWLGSVVGEPLQALQIDDDPFPWQEMTYTGN
ncbi:hypothetical protein VKT23_012620 [Stygiomarasmius scandens]|uniref:Uncharacterized protein n=1 Tax=Marasmiellus scandens TaxID=2682957 RepID=A0ABR1J5M2_9AGAR